MSDSALGPDRGYLLWITGSAKVEMRIGYLNQLLLLWAIESNILWSILHDVISSELRDTCYKCLVQNIRKEVLITKKLLNKKTLFFGQAPYLP